MCPNMVSTLADAWPPLAAVVTRGMAVWNDAFSKGLKPAAGMRATLLTVWRSWGMQHDLWRLGRDVYGTITDQSVVVTDADGGQSPHGEFPALAVDIQLSGTPGKTDYSALAALMPELEWGGEWVGFVDVRHFQAPGYAWRLARAGTFVPTLRAVAA
jgi:hypothetical protein